MATYFGAIIKSVVHNIIMPPFDLALGSVNFSRLGIEFKAAEMNEVGELVTEAVDRLW